MSDTPCPARHQYAAGIIENYDDHVLIVRCPAEAAVPRQWLFPRGPVQPGEAPEAALRHLLHEQLGLRVEIVVGQPPLVAMLDGEEVELRYFFCGIATGTPQAGPYAEFRFVSRLHLAEYDFDPASAEVAQWLQHPR
ncbi:MAG TPA: NUDIX domain-containing protein [Phycisphaerae bacterium]|nr:NUDIX domain-containing protein [Phycisphaerae bacterium]HNU44910.1 NUDIX domain-containing protein [Phycisphaerae bacterium]